MDVDHVDLIQLHNLVEPDEWDVAHGPGGAVEALARARDEGLVRYIGVTGHGLRIAEMHLALAGALPVRLRAVPVQPLAARRARLPGRRRGAGRALRRATASPCRRSSRSPAGAGPTTPPSPRFSLVRAADRPGGDRPGGALRARRSAPVPQHVERRPPAPATRSRPPPARSTARPTTSSPPTRRRFGIPPLFDGGHPRAHLTRQLGPVPQSSSALLVRSGGCRPPSLDPSAGRRRLPSTSAARCRGTATGASTRPPGSTPRRWPGRCWTPDGPATVLARLGRRHARTPAAWGPGGEWARRPAIAMTGFDRPPPDVPDAHPARHRGGAAAGRRPDRVPAATSTTPCCRRSSPSASPPARPSASGRGCATSSASRRPGPTSGCCSRRAPTASPVARRGGSTRSASRPSGPGRSPRSGASPTGCGTGCACRSTSWPPSWPSCAASGRGPSAPCSARSAATTTPSPSATTTSRAWCRGTSPARPAADDARMLELLEPFRGERGRVRPAARHGRPPPAGVRPAPTDPADAPMVMARTTPAEPAIEPPPEDTPPDDGADHRRSSRRRPGERPAALVAAGGDDRHLRLRRLAAVRPRRRRRARQPGDGRRHRGPRTEAGHARSA